HRDLLPRAKVSERLRRQPPASGNVSSPFGSSTSIKITTRLRLARGTRSNGRSNRTNSSHAFRCCCAYAIRPKSNRSERAAAVRSRLRRRLPAPLSSLRLGRALPRVDSLSSQVEPARSAQHREHLLDVA